MKICQRFIWTSAYGSIKCDAGIYAETYAESAEFNDPSIFVKQVRVNLLNMSHCLSELTCWVCWIHFNPNTNISWNLVQMQLSC